MQSRFLTLALLACSLPFSQQLSLGAARCTAPAAARALPQRHAAATMILGLGEKQEAAVAPKTIGDAKNAFQAAYGKPVGMMLQGFVNEMLSSVQVAMVSPTFEYSRVFALGFDTLCTTFLDATPSAVEKEHLTASLCRGLSLDPERIAKDAADLKAEAAGKSEEELLALDDFKAIAALPTFKYSYPFGAGVLELMKTVEVEASEASIERWCEALEMRSDRLKKDWAFFEQAIDRLAEGRQMMAEMQAAAKRKEAAKLKEEAAKAMADADAAEAAVADKAE